MVRVGSAWKLLRRLAPVAHGLTLLLVVAPRWNGADDPRYCAGMGPASSRPEIGPSGAVRG